MTVSTKALMTALSNCSGGGVNCERCQFNAVSGCISEMNRQAVNYLKIQQDEIERLKKEVRKNGSY